MKMASSAPIPSSSNTTIEAWKSALADYKRSVPKKDYQQIQQSTSAQDVVTYVEELQRKEQHRQHASLLEIIGKHIGRFERFSQAVDMLAQGSPSPACLIWGSIKFAIVLVRGYAEEHQKLLKALQMMAEFLPRIDFYAELFAHSTLFEKRIEMLYIAIIKFWARAIKFYKQRRLWKIAKFWNDFDVEFGDFEDKIRQCQQTIEGDARFEHESQAHASRLEQTRTTQATLASIKSQERRDIVRWLAPSGYEADYFEDDMEVARKLRHQDTCKWILSISQFKQWLDAVAPSEHSFLWIYAIPGAGKTVLTAFLIDSQTTIFPAAPLLIYFFFKNTDADKNTPTAAARSLVYQLYSRLLSSNGDVVSVLSEAINKSGQTNSKSFRSIWNLLVRLASHVPQLVIILDAVDECDDAGDLLRCLLQLSREAPVKVMCTSRREKKQLQELETAPSFEMGPNEVSGDIRVFIDYKVSKSPKLSHPLVKSSVIQVLKNHNRGMFLWVALMIKELKSNLSFHEMKKSLESIPDNLSEIYERILIRLQSSLRSSAREFCCRILKWIVCASRPLKLEELREALQIDYAARDFLGSDETLLYSTRDIELVCGSLIVIRGGTVELVHLSAKKYLQESPLNDELPRMLSDFFIDSEKSNSSLALHCTTYLLIHCQPEDLPPKDVCQWADSIFKSKAKLPLLEYACSNWLAHAADGISSSPLAPRSSILKFIYSRASVIWVYYCLVLESYSSYQLLFDLGRLNERAMDECVGQAHTDFDNLQKWLRSWLHVLEDYLHNLDRMPSDLLFMHPQDIFGPHDFPCYKLAATNHYEKLTYLKTLASNPSTNPIAENQYLEKENSLSFPMWFFAFDARRDCFYFVDQISTHSYHLYCQDRTTGRRLHRLGDNELGDKKFMIDVEGGQLRSDGNYIGLVCNFTDPADGAFGERFYTAVWRIQDHLDFTSGRRNTAWATKIMSTTTRSSVFQGSLRPLTFASGILHCPSGQIHLKTTEVQEYPPTLFRQDEAGNPFLFFAFSGDGASIVSMGGRKFHKSTIDGRNLQTFSPPEDVMIEDLQPLGFSHTGRYILWREYHLYRPVLLLQDTISGHRHVIPEGREMWGKNNFSFSSDESRLVGIYEFADEDQVLLRHVLVWSLDEVPVFYGKRVLGYAVLQSYIHDETHTLYIAQGDDVCRLWQRFSLSDPRLTDLDAPIDEVNPIHIVQKVCREGEWLATLQHDGNKVNLSFQDLYDTERDGIFVELGLAVSIEKLRSLEIIFSHDLSAILVDDKIFLNLRQEPHSRSLSLPLTLGNIDEDQNDEAIRWKKTTEISTSSCGRYIAVNRRIGLDSGTALHLDVFEVKSASFSCLHHERVRNLLTQCIGLQIDFHPCLPKLAMIFWDEIDDLNQLGKPCERVRCLIWDLDMHQVLIIGETLDFSTSFVFRHDWHSTKFSKCGSYVILGWNRLTRQEFNMPGHDRTPSLVSPFPCELASQAGILWGDRVFETWSAPDCVWVQIRQSGDSTILRNIILTSVPRIIGQCNATVLNGNQKRPNLRLLLRRKSGLSAIKQLRWTWDEFLREFPS